MFMLCLGQEFVNGLNRYWIGRLLDSYLQTYWNNLAVQQRLRTQLNYTP